MKKRFIAVLMSAMLVAGSLTGCGSSEKSGEETTGQQSVEGSSAETAQETKGKVLNIYCWNDSFKTLVEDYYLPAGRLPEDVTINWVTIPSADNAYQNSLDEALLKQSEVSADEKVDMFLVEADYALKYAQADVTLDVQKDIGLTEEQMSQMYDYTKQIMTTDNGSIKGVTGFAAPGLFAYRRSIAKEVLGTDDPAEVQKQLENWEKFDEAAKKASDKGYKMLAGYNDSYRVFSNNVSKPWVEGTEIQIDENIDKWIKQTKNYTEKGYNNKHGIWSDGWAADQGPEGDVFGFFYSTWGVNFTLMANALETAVADGGKEEAGNGIYGDYGVCMGPESFYWGGTWFCAASGTDNAAEIKDIMEFFCCEKEPMKQMATETIDFANHKEAMEEVAASDFSSAFLGGQNPYQDFCKAAQNINMENTSIYDQGLNDAIGTAMGDYFDGNVDYNTALQNFYKIAGEKYPELRK